MQNYFCLIASMGLVFSTSTSSAEVLSKVTSRVELQEFKIDASSGSHQRNAECTADEIDRGVVNAPTFSRRDKNSRDLIPSFRPLVTQASWLLKDGECKNLSAEFNGIGFASFDSVTGEATIYLAKFEPEHKDEQDETIVERVNAAVNAEYKFSNAIYFKAKCSTVTHLFGLGSMTCRINDNRGSVSFTIHRA